MFEGTYLNIVIATYFVASGMLFLLMNVFYLYIAFVKRVVLIFVIALYKSTSLSSSSSSLTRRPDQKIASHASSAARNSV